MSNLTHLWNILLGTFIGLLPVINPLAAAPAASCISSGRLASAP